jgi:hypothetical protein
MLPIGAHQWTRKLSFPDYLASIGFSTKLTLQDYLSAIALSTLVSLGLAKLLQKWLFTRLTESIKTEYTKELQVHKRRQDELLADYKQTQDEKLQEHKRTQDARLAEQRGAIEAQLKQIEHVNEVGRLRTSLFFEHQQKAFQTILTETARTIDLWSEQYDREMYIYGSVPAGRLELLSELIRNNQLFIDPDCALALQMLQQVYRQSRPFDDGGGGPAIERDGRKQYDDAEYLQPRIASLFQKKIGVQYDRNAVSEVILFGIIRFLQEYKRGCTDEWFTHIVSENLDAEDSIAFARDNWRDFYSYLLSLRTSLFAEGWMSYAPYKRLDRLLGSIKELQAEQRPGTDK